MATYEDDTKPQYEFYGPVSVDLAAPYEGFTCRRGGGYEYAGCSAFAASYVSGAAALLWAKFPYLTNLQVKEKILDSADVIPALNGLCVTGGRLNLHDMFYGWKANANAVKVSAGSVPIACAARSSSCCLTFLVAIACLRAGSSTAMGE